MFYILFKKHFNSEFSHIEEWLADQNSKPLEIEDKINIALVFNCNMAKGLRVLV